MEKVAELALKQYESQKKRSNDYYNRKKQQKVEDGTYRGRGRPRKVNEPTPQKSSTSSSEV